MRLVKALLMSLAVAAVAAPTVVAPAAQAKSATYAAVWVRAQELPANAPVPDGPSGLWHVKLGSTLHLTARSYIHVPATASGTSPQVWRFAFWDIGATPSFPTAGHGKIEQSTSVKFKASAAGTFAATAWYLPHGASTCLQGQLCSTAVTAAVFDESQDAPVPGLNPIAMVTPGSAWTAGTPTVSTTGVSPTIYAQQCVGGTFQYPKGPFGSSGCTSSQVFSTWLGSGTSSTADKVPAGDDGYAIAVTDYTPPVQNTTSTGGTGTKMS
jgi:hypothetical protein